MTSSTICGHVCVRPVRPQARPCPDRARDRFGIKPLYYHLTADAIFFASEPKALLPFVPSIEPDHEGIRDYLVFQMPLEHRTLFRHIQQLQRRIG